MQDTIPISVDDRRFSIMDWLGFLGLFTFWIFLFGIHAVAFSVGIWGRVWVDDFTKADLILAVGLTSIAGFPWLAFCGFMFFLALSDKAFTRGSVLLDSRAGRLILKRRHITGFTWRKSLALAEVRDLDVAWSENEDGTVSPSLRLIPSGSPVLPDITKPADSVDIPAFAARLRAELAAVGWAEAYACGCPKGEACPDRC